MILVTGGTGFIGRRLVARMQEAGIPVRLLLNARRAEQLESLGLPQPPDVVVGTILDEEALFRAVSGVHAIIHLENCQWWGRAGDFERIELAGTRALIAAARAARVGRIITVSQLGAAPASAYTLHRYKGQVEETIRAGGLAYTILRAGLVFGEDDSFFNHIAMQLKANPLVFLMPGQGEVVLHPIHIDDLVTALLRTLSNISTVDATIEIGGPEYITLRDLIRTIMRVTGTSRLVVGVPPYLLRWLTAVYARVLPRSLITSQWLDILATNRTARINTIFEMFDIRPRRLEDTLLTYLRGRPHTLPMLRYTFRRRPRLL
jgi:NADH dehydrogenase